MLEKKLLSKYSRSFPDLSYVWPWLHTSYAPNLNRDLDKITKTQLNVLIIGESGTGKELIARELHMRRLNFFHYSNQEAPYLCINTSNIPEALAESMLFGHERGAFTSARDMKLGKFENAKKGCLFLDEIQNLSLSTQAKLLRVLQEREIERLGSIRARKIHCQVVASSNIPLEILLKEKKFRKDLYYRLNVYPIYLPPLRELKPHLPEYIKFYLKRICKNYNHPLPELSSDAFELMLQHNWPGNLRELEHSLTYATLKCDKVILKNDLPPIITGELQSYLNKGDWN